MKKKFFAVVLAASMVLPMPVGGGVTANAETNDTVDTASDLVMYYSFDNILDNGVTGGKAATVKSGNLKYTDGVSGKAFDCTLSDDGDTAGMLETAGVPETDTKEFTVNFFMKQESTIGRANSAVFLDTNCQYLQIGSNPGECWPMARMSSNGTHSWDDDGRLDRFATGKMQAPTDWKMVTLTVNSNGSVVMYVDGVAITEYYEPVSTEGWFLKADGTSFFSNQLEGWNKFTIGGGDWWNSEADGGAANGGFDGAIDEFSFYSRALTAADVKALYNDKGIPQGVSDVKTYAQYKPNTDGTYTVRIISEVALSDTDIANYSKVGFRCSKVASLAGDSYFGTNIYKEIKANGEIITAAEGKYFVILEIKNVTADATLYAQAVNESASGSGTFGKEVTVKMADIIKNN